MLASLLSLYLSANILLALAWGILQAGHWLLRKIGRPLRASASLRLHYFTLPLVVTCLLLSPLLPGQNFRPAAQVWSAGSMKSFARDYTENQRRGFFRLSSRPGSPMVKTDHLGKAGFAFAALLFAALLLHIGRDFKTILRIRRRSFTIKKIGRVVITTNGEISVPFTYWFPGGLTVVLPTSLLSNAPDTKIALTHELQHHRQGDTRWIYALWLLRAIGALNPFAHLWVRWVLETQEFACDEALVSLKKVDSKAYARCLVTVAETANRQEFYPACATGLIFLTERNLLKRRIEYMQVIQGRKKSRKSALAIAAVLLATLTTATYAAKGLVQDRRVSFAQAEKMRERAQSKTDIPVVVNGPVVRQLNRLLGTQEGRTYLRASLARMEIYQEMVHRKITQAGAPAALVAVPLHESGYQNLPQRQKGGKSAGIWQFIPETARIYGLRVDQKVDERLDPEKETNAGLLYLSGLYRRFHDWQLALMAYNMGERALQNAIDESGSREPWELIRQGYEGDRDYLAGFMAMLIIQQNPDSLD